MPEVTGLVDVRFGLQEHLGTSAGVRGWASVADVEWRVGFARSHRFWLGTTGGITFSFRLQLHLQAVRILYMPEMMNASSKSLQIACT